MAYILDTDVLVQAANRHYRFAVCPGFWCWLDKAYGNGIVLSVKKVRDEVLQREDDLAKWCKSRKKMFADTDDDKTFESFKLLTAWVAENYQPAAQAAFCGCADFNLVGFANAHSHTVVTHEILSGPGAHKVKIPNACKAMDVPTITPFAMLEAENVKFVLG
jgi:hypothetical protein